MLVVILCLILITGVIVIASASEATKPHEPAQEVGQESHGVPLGGETQETGLKEGAEGAHEVTGEEQEAEGHEVAPEGESHEVSEGGEEGHEAAPEGGEHGAPEGEEEHEAPEGEHEVPTREHGAPAAYFFVGAFILLAIVIARHKYDDRSDLSRKIPGLIAATIYIFSIMVIAHYIAGTWSLILVPVFLLVLLRLWPHI
ncbi:MAG: hypothetical protein ACE5PM_09350 [Candidatus Hydrothermarchaeales archaeon]